MILMQRVLAAGTVLGALVYLSWRTWRTWRHAAGGRRATGCDHGCGCG